MKYLFIILLIIFSQPSTLAQTTAPAPADTDTTQSNLKNNAIPIETFDPQMPSYKGGQEALVVFMRQNLKYPKHELFTRIQGIVLIGFVVEKDGSTSEHQILRGIENGKRLDKEALRVCKLLRYEKPAMQNNKPVRFRVSFPVSFTIEEIPKPD